MENKQRTCRGALSGPCQQSSDGEQRGEQQRGAPKLPVGGAGAGACARAWRRRPAQKYKRGAGGALSGLSGLTSSPR